MVGVDRLVNYLESILSPLTSHPSPLKNYHYEYTNKKGNLEADSSAHSFNRYGDSNNAGYVCKKSCMRGQLFLIHSHVFHGADHEAGGTSGSANDAACCAAADVKGILLRFARPCTDGAALQINIRPPFLRIGGIVNIIGGWYEYAVARIDVLPSQPEPIMSVDCFFRDGYIRKQQLVVTGCRYIPS